MSATKDVDNEEEQYREKRITYCGNRDGCEGEGITDYVARVDAAAPVLSRVLHFAQGW